MKHLRSLLPLSILSLFIIVAPASAQNSSAGNPNRGNAVGVMEKTTNTQMMQQQNQVQENKMMMEQSNALKEKIQEKRAMMKDQIEEKKSQFRERLQLIQDENKQRIVENIDARLDSINSKQIDRMTQVLDKLNDIMIRITDKATEAESDGTDITQFNTLKAAAETALSNASDMLAAQAEKDYTPSITDESTLGQTTSTSVTKLKSDLKNVNQSIISARNAVRLAAVEVAKYNSNQSENGKMMMKESKGPSMGGDGMQNSAMEESTMMENDTSTNQ